MEKEKFSLIKSTPEHRYINDNDILPLLKRGYSRTTHTFCSYPIDQEKLFTLETKHCEPSTFTFQIQEGTSRITVSPKIEGKLLIKSWQNNNAVVIAALPLVYFSMTIVNKLNHKIFLNAPNSTRLTNKSPYTGVKAKQTKEFYISQEDMDKQTIAFPGGYPDKISLPINSQNTCFIINTGYDSSGEIITIKDVSSEKIIGTTNLHKFKASEVILYKYNGDHQ